MSYGQMDIKTAKTLFDKISMHNPKGRHFFQSPIFCRGMFEKCFRAMKGTVIPTLPFYSDLFSFWQQKMRYSQIFGHKDD